MATPFRGTPPTPPSLRPGVPPLGVRRDLFQTPERETGEWMDNLFERIGPPIMEALDAPGEYGLRPIIGNISRPFVTAEGEYTPESLLAGIGNILNDPLGAFNPGVAAIARGAAETATPEGYQQGRERSEQFRGSLPPSLRVGYDIATDPLMYVAPGVGGAIARSARTPRAVRAALAGTRNPAAAVIEGVGPARVPLTALGSSAGIEAAERYDIPGIPEAAEQIAAQLAGGALGAGLISPRGAIASAVRGGGDQTPRQRVDISTGRVREAPIIQQSNFPTPELRSATDKVLEGARREQNLRRTGRVQAEIREGRRRQARGVQEGIEEARARGLSGEEAVRVGRAGARGRLRETTTRIELTPEERRAVFDELGERATRGDMSTFDYLRNTRAVEKLIDGDGLQPNEIKAIRGLFGEEVANTAKQRPRKSRLERQDEESLETQRERLAAQQEKRALKQQQQSVRQLEQANRKAFNEQFKADQQYFRDKWKAIARQQEINQQQVDDLWNDLKTTPEERDIALGELRARQERLQREAGTEFERARNREATRIKQMKDRLEREERKELQEIERFTRQQQRQGAKQRQQEARQALNEAEARDRQALREKWRSLYTTNESGRLPDIPERLLRQLQSPIGLSDTERRIARQALDRRLEKVQTAAGDAADWAMSRGNRPEFSPERVQYRRRLYEAFMNEQDKRLAIEARDAIDREVARLDITPELREQIPQTIEAWRKGGSVRLDATDIETSSLVRLIAKPSNIAAGRHGDSYLAAITTEKGLLRTALEMNGLPEEAAKSISDTLVVMQLQKRFKQGVPTGMAQDMADARVLPVKHIRKVAQEPDAIVAPQRERTAWDALGDLAQRIKNIQFGIGDLAIFGQQVLRAFATAGPSAMAGLTNRFLMMMHLPHLTPYDQSIGLAKNVAYNLDGVHQGIRTGMFDVEAGGDIPKSILSDLGLGKIDRPLMRVAERLTDFQFSTVLGNLRNMIHEGNLVIAHLAGEDVMNPAVRARAAAFANSSTSAAARAQRGTQAQAERGLLLSPSMRRAQASQLAQIGRLLSPKASRTDRVLAASTIASQGIYTLAVGKLLHDYFGVGDFEYDPSKPRFGRITINIAGKNRTIDVFPQDQLQSALLKSIRLLAEEEPLDAAEQWARIANNSASPPLQGFLKSMGIGFDPRRGYQWGNYGADMSLMERFVTGSILPPIGQEAYLEGGDPAQLGLSGVGLTAFVENPSTTIARQYEEDTGRDYWEDVSNEPGMVDRWLDDHPEMEQMHQQNIEERAAVGEAWAENMLESQEYGQEFLQRQRALDEQLQANEISPEQWRRQRSSNLDVLYAKRDTIYANADTPEEKNLLDRYYEKLEQAEDETGAFDYGPVEAWLQSLPPQDRAKIERNTGLREKTPLEQEYAEDVEYIANSGYWDAADEVAKRVAQKYDQIPNDISSQGELQDYLRQQWQQKAEERGLEPGSLEHRTYVDQGVTASLKRVNWFDWRSTVLERFREQDPELRRKLIKWGYKPPSQEEAEAIIDAD